MQLFTPHVKGQHEVHVELRCCTWLTNPAAVCCLLLATALLPAGLAWHTIAAAAFATEQGCLGCHMLLAYCCKGWSDNVIGIKL
jgi:hypothetical protein